jgi:hypothetical protein
MKGRTTRKRRLVKSPINKLGLYHNIISMIQTTTNTVIIITLVAMHWIMFSGTMLVILLTDDLSILVLANMFLYLILMMNIIFGDCPMSLIEDQYLGNSMVDSMNHFVPFRAELTTRGNTTLQWIFMSIMVSTTKIILLLIKHTFHEFLSK